MVFHKVTPKELNKSISEYKNRLKISGLQILKSRRANSYWGYNNLPMKESRVRNIGVTSEASRGMTLNPSDTSNEPETTS